MSADTAKGNCMTHQMSLKNRESMEVSGVTDVISFDEQSVILSTTCGNIEIGGASLHIHVLSMDGRIDSVTYYEQESSDTEGKRGLFAKLFR